MDLGAALWAVSVISGIALLIGGFGFGMIDEFDSYFGRAFMVIMFIMFLVSTAGAVGLQAQKDSQKTCGEWSNHEYKMGKVPEECDPGQKRMDNDYVKEWESEHN